MIRFFPDFIFLTIFQMFSWFFPFDFAAFFYIINSKKPYFMENGIKTRERINDKNGSLIE